MLQNQDVIRRCITNIQNNENTILNVQRDLLKTQFEMQQDIRRLDQKIDNNAKDTSEIFQEICKRLDKNKITKRKIAIL